MAAIDCYIYLFCLRPDVTAKAFLEYLPGGRRSQRDTTTYIVRGRVHGWVQRPHHPHEEQLLAHEWDVFSLTREPVVISDHEVIVAEVSIKVAVPHEQYSTLLNSKQASCHTTEDIKPLPETPALPEPWPKTGGIPPSAIMESSNAPLKPGELRLDRSMADFLTSALPPTVANSPVSLFNLFKYPADTGSTVHDAYMEGFKSSFGNTAGASVRFMGPVGSSSWDDANLVQYDNIWHYAYMLSTDVYAGLNKQKVEGLEDTCILCVSEIELAM